MHPIASGTSPRPPHSPLDSHCPGDSSALPRRRFLGLLGAGLAAAAIPASLRAAPPAGVPKPGNILSADEALDRLVRGNRRYVDGTMNPHDFASERKALAAGQNPYAAILSCADSRIGPEFAFDTARGDVFVVRVAGNFVSAEGLASLEYTTAVLGTPLIVVLGHDKCGAVDAAIETVNDGAKLPGHLPGLIGRIKPAVKAVGKLSPAPVDFLAEAIRENVRLNVAKLEKSGPLISKMVEEGRVRVVGGVYSLDTGHVEFLS